MLFYRSKEPNALAQSISQTQELLTQIFLTAIVFKKVQGGGLKGKVLCTNLTTWMALDALTLGEKTP